LTDTEVLLLAARSNRLLVTHDRKTMPRHFAEFLASQSSAGVLIVPQKLPAFQVVDEILLIWTATEAEEWTNRIFSCRSSALKADICRLCKTSVVSFK
jgi:hypothetical protein